MVDPSFGRTLLVVLVAVGGGAVLAFLGAAPTGRVLTRALGDRPHGARALVVGLALLTGVVMLCLGLGAAGLPLRLLGPENWPELTDGLDRGLGGVQGVNWPYDGQDWWIRQTILLGAPFLLAIAATLAFFPSRRAAPLLRAAGLVVLLVLYGTAVTEHDPGQPLLRGLALLVLVAGWLWLPRLGAREAAAGAAVVVAVGVLSLPPAAALDGEKPWWDYRAWNWFGGGTPITFDWNHEYGPLDWPREGTTLLNVRSDRPHYWKAETLDGFDGFRWVRTPAADSPDQFVELPRQFGFKPWPDLELPRVQRALGRGDRGDGALAHQRADRGGRHHLRGGRAEGPPTAWTAPRASWATRSRRATRTRRTHTRRTRTATRCGARRRSATRTTSSATP